MFKFYVDPSKMIQFTEQLQRNNIPFVSLPGVICLPDLPIRQYSFVINLFGDMGLNDPVISFERQLPNLDIKK